MPRAVPDYVRANWELWFGLEQAVRLVASTERRLTDAIAEWELEDVEPLDGGQVALVCGCRYRGRPAVLKVSPRRREETWTNHETEALRLWAGLAPDVLAARDDGWTVLLERLKPGVPLADCRAPLETLEILGELSQQLRCYPASSQFPSLGTGALGESWRTNLRHSPDALAEFEDLLATGGDPVVLHGDFHPLNVLADQDSWRVIDPKPHRGDPHADCFLFLGFAEDLPDTGAAETVDEWLSLYSAAAGLDERRLRRWTRVSAEAELGWWPEGKPGWGPNMSRLLAAL